MARSFDGTNDYITNASADPPAPGTGPFTVAFRFRALSNAQTQTYICSGIAGENACAILYEYVDNQVEAFGSGGPADPRTGSQIAVADTNWHHIAYRKQNGTAEWARYLDGTKTVISASINFTIVAGATEFMLGAGAAAGVAGNFCNCEIAEFALWHSALPDAHIEAMGKGYAPTFWNPDFYWPLIGKDSPERGVKGQIDLTVNGATAGDHPRIIYPL